MVIGYFLGYLLIVWPGVTSHETWIYSSTAVKVWTLALHDTCCPQWHPLSQSLPRLSWCPYLATALSNHMTHICKGAVCSCHRSFRPFVWCWTRISSQFSCELVVCPAVSHLRYRSQLQGSDWSHCIWGPWLLWTCWIRCAYQLCIQTLWQR